MSSRRGSASSSAPGLPGLFDADASSVAGAPTPCDDGASQLQRALALPALQKKPLSLDAIWCGEVEEALSSLGSLPLIGLDEAGRGPLAGPVAVAACALPWPCPIEGLNDSKRLTETTREALYEAICEHALGYAIVLLSPAEIDAMNILRASLHGMKLAWEQLTSAQPHLRQSIALIDGRDRAPLPSNAIQAPLIKGDARSLNVAAASILAKVTRDRLMGEAHQRFPMYGFDKHKGYPTVAHRKAIEQHGPCELHRKSFGTVAAAIAQREAQGLS